MTKTNARTIIIPFRSRNSAHFTFTSPIKSGENWPESYLLMIWLLNIKEKYWRWDYLWCVMYILYKVSILIGCCACFRCLTGVRVSSTGQPHTDWAPALGRLSLSPTSHSNTNISTHRPGVAQWHQRGVLTTLSTEHWTSPVIISHHQTLRVQQLSSHHDQQLHDI